MWGGGASYQLLQSLSELRQEKDYVWRNVSDLRIQLMPAQEEQSTSQSQI